MTSGAVARNTRWSFSALRREHGEERALALLQYMPGLGAYAEVTSNGAELRYAESSGSPWDMEVHDEAPRVEVVLPCDLDLSVIGQSWAERYWLGDVQAGGCGFFGEDSGDMRTIMLRGIQASTMRRQARGRRASPGVAVPPVTGR